MEIQAVIHRTEKGGYWAEFPAVSNCFAEGDTREELMRDIDFQLYCHLGSVSVCFPEEIAKKVEVIDVTI